MKKKYVGLVVLCVVSSAIGASLALALRPIPQTRSGLPEIISAQGFELVDSSGNRRASLGFSEQAVDPLPVLRFFSPEGTLRLSTGLHLNHWPFLMLQNAPLPYTRHKRISLMIEQDVAAMEMGHGELSEISIRSAQPSEQFSNMLRLRARNTSWAGFFTDDYGHATFEVVDSAARSVLRVPDWQPLLLPEQEQP